jgi:hypothetical protein
MTAHIGPPVTPGETQYTIHESYGVIADLSLDLTATNPSQFTITYPTVTTGVEIVLTGGPTSTTQDLTAMASGSSVQVLSSGGTLLRTIEVVKVPGPLTQTLTCIITGAALLGDIHLWTVSIRAASAPATAPDWTFQQGENDPTALTITRLMCDPRSGFTPTGNVREKDTILFTGVGPPVGPGTVVGGPTPSASVRWNFEGSVAMPSAFPHCEDLVGDPSTVVPSLVAQMPAVYGDTTITVKEEVWLASSCPTAGFLSSSASNPLTIQSRPQRLLLVLDRSGSMASENRWDNALKGARLLVHLINAFRPGVNADDAVGILVFEDSRCDWRDGVLMPVDPLQIIADKIPLGPLATADGLISGTPSLDFGPPGTCTPIGDALKKAMKELDTWDDVVNEPHFTIILLTDGIENSGAVKVDAATSAPGFVTLFSTEREAIPDVNNRLSLFTIGLGTYVQDHVLDQLPLPPDLPTTTSPPIYRNVTQVNELADAIGQMVSFSLEARTKPPLPGAPTPADDATDHTGAVYFELESNVRMLAVCVLWPPPPLDPTDTVHIYRRTLPLAAATAFVEVPVVPKRSPTHGFVSRDLSVDFGPSVPATQWRVERWRGTPAVRQTISANEILIFKDLYAKADILFDQRYYGTGDSMVISARVRAGDQPVSGATISVELAEPGESLGTFLVQGSKGYEPPRPHGVDPLSPKAAMLATILHRRELDSLPILEPTGIFVDGTDELHEVADHPDGPGNYANTYGPITKEGTYTFRFTVRAKLPDGSPYDEVMTISRWVGVKVDPFTSSLVVHYGQPAPAGMQAALVVVTPQDLGGQYLGPFWANEVEFDATIGTFQGEVESHSDGTYSQLLVYPKGRTPIVNVSVQGTPFPPIPVATGCLGVLLRPVLWLYRWLVRLATGK